MTVKQPFAGLIVAGIKDIENRTWQRPHRGRLWIHSSSQPARRQKSADPTCMAIAKSLDLADRELAKHEFCFPDLLNLHGYLLGYVELSAIVRTHPSKWAIPGNFHWVLKNPHRIRPKKMVGGCMLWNPTTR